MIGEVKARCVVDERGCWIWQGALSGYRRDRPVVKRRSLNGNVNIYVSRLLWEELYGPLEEREVHHECRNPRCCNPEHLRAVSKVEHGEAHQKAYCKWGHPLTPENLRQSELPKRSCRICHARRSNESYYRRKAAHHKAHEKIGGR